MPTLNDYTKAWNNLKTPPKSRVQDYMNALIPCLTMVLPLFFLDAETYNKTDFNVYVKMVVSTLIPIFVTDMSGILDYIRSTLGLKNDHIQFYTHSEECSSKFATCLKHNKLQILSRIPTIFRPIVYYEKTDSYNQYDMSGFYMIYVKELDLELFMISENGTYSFGHTDDSKIKNFFKWYRTCTHSTLEGVSSIYVLKESDEKQQDTTSETNTQQQRKRDIKIELRGKNNSILDKSVLSEFNEKSIYSSLAKFTDHKHIKKLDTLGLNNNLFILFHGPPGTSKTTISMGIAKYLNRDILLVDKTTPDLFFEYASKIDYSKYVILMDDIDFWDMSSREEGKNKNLLRLMELLNGNSFTNGCIIFTTNHLDKFDPALFREGRVHLKLHITGMTTQIMWEKFIKNIYPDHLDLRSSSDHPSSDQLVPILDECSKNKQNQTGTIKDYFNVEEMNKLCSLEIPLCTISELVKSHFDSIDTFITEIKHKYL